MSGLTEYERSLHPRWARFAIATRERKEAEARAAAIAQRRAESPAVSHPPSTARLDVQPRYQRKG